MLTAKRAGARLGYPTPLQQRAVPVQRNKATEQPSDRTTRHYKLNSKLSNIHVGKLPKKTPKPN
jgi:hypothetical protein